MSRIQSHYAPLFSPVSIDNLAKRRYVSGSHRWQVHIHGVAGTAHSLGENSTRRPLGRHPIVGTQRGEVSVGTFSPGAPFGHRGRARIRGWRHLRDCRLVTERSAFLPASFDSPNIRSEPLTTTFTVFDSGANKIGHNIRLLKPLTRTHLVHSGRISAAGFQICRPEKTALG